MKKRKILAFVLCVVMLLSTSSGVFAVSSPTEALADLADAQNDVESTVMVDSHSDDRQATEEQVPERVDVEKSASVESNVTMSESKIREYALNFMKKSQDNASITIKQFVPLYDLLDNTTGYYVTFSNDGKDMGYVLLSLITDGSPIVEFAFEGAGLNINTNKINLASRADTRNEAGVSRIIYTGPESFFVPSGDGEYYSVYNQREVSESAVEQDFMKKYPQAYTAKTRSVDIYDGIIDWSDADVDSSSVFKIDDFGAGTDYWLMTNFSSGGVCCPTAATNILWYWGYNRGCSSIMDRDEVADASSNKRKAKAIFNILYDGMGTDDDGTYDKNILDGYEAFFGEDADEGLWDYSKIKDGASYSKYRSALNGDCPVMLILHTKDGIFNKGDGHSVFAFGYASSTNDDDYLFVMDGWNEYGRFVKFDYYPYFFGYKIWVAS